MKLTSMTDFVLEQFKLLYNTKISQDRYVTRTKKNADFLKQKLELGMFIPCDEDGNVLEDPELTMMQGDGQFYYSTSDEDFKVYEKAKEKVLFKAVDFGDAEHLCDQFNTIEDMVNYCNEDLTLTQSAIKQIGL